MKQTIKFKRIMKPASIPLATTTWPKLAQPKLDGIRMSVQRNQAITTSLKPIPNRAIRAMFSNISFFMFDGELIAGTFAETASLVMSHHKPIPPNLRFHVFDLTLPLLNAVERQAELDVIFSTLHVSPYFRFVTRVPTTTITNEKQASAYYDKLIHDGYEGMILRSPFAVYKHGRASKVKQELVKMKRSTTIACTITGYEPLMINRNEPNTNERGLTERPSATAGRWPINMLGALHCSCPGFEPFKVGTGFSDAQRSTLWTARSTLIGRRIYIKYFNYGIKDRPRHPVFLMWFEGYRNDS